MLHYTVNQHPNRPADSMVTLASVLDRVRARKRLENAEMKARLKQSKRGRWPKVAKIVKAERALGPPGCCPSPRRPQAQYSQENWP